MSEAVSRASVLEGSSGGEVALRPREQFSGAYFRAGNLLELRAMLFREALARVFGAAGRKSAYYRDFALVAAFLSMPRLFELVFKRLDQDLHRALARMGMEIPNRITTCFYDLFEDYGHGGFPRVHNIVLVGSSFNVFGPIVSGGYLFKDGTGPNHGEYTHTLQWLAVAKAQKMGILKLDHSVYELYCNSAGAGTLSTVNLLRGDSPTASKAAIWQFLVDCFPETDEHREHLLDNLMSNSYRTPSYLMRSLFSGPLRGTVMARYLARRYERRAEAFGNAEGMRLYHLEKQSKKGSLYSTQEGVNITVPVRSTTGTLVGNLTGQRGVVFQRGRL